MLLKFSYLFLLSGFLNCAWAQTQSPTTDQQKLQSLVEACTSAKTKDPVCEYIVTLKQIGDDSIEAIKQYVKLGPYQYYALTALNFALTGRLRFKTDSIFSDKGSYIFDYKKDEIFFIYQLDF